MNNFIYLMAQKQLAESIRILFIAIVVILTLGTFLFSWLEGWTLVDSFYFVTMTATTVGYGDLTPTTNLTKIITIFYSLTIVPFILYAFSAVAKFEVDKVYHRVHSLQRKQAEQKEDIEKTERKLSRTKHDMKEQEEELVKTERKLQKQAKINKEQESELKSHQRKIKKVDQVNKVQEVALKKHDKELNEVEDIVVKKAKNRAKKKRKK